MNNILLIGNPNTGKSTLFNSLTGANAHTGNWHGVTVEQTSKEFKYLDKTFSIIDLPGIYSMSPISFEERVTVEYVYSHLPCKIINIVDANNIYRNLYLTQELLRLKIPMLLVINKTSN
ncbi:MAG: 50S ribosome-binding GTPase, partial [Clostridia bacterium]|nr:50S ribosome-binding GTPase [Clostridia bacterium]